MISSIRKFLRQFRYSAWVLEGVEKHSGVDMRIVYVGGNISQKNYIQNLLFKGVTRDTYLGRLWLFKPARYRPEQVDKCEMVIIEIDKRYIEGAVQPRFYVPCWIGGKADIDETLQLSEKKEAIKHEVRRIRKNGFTYQIVHSREEYIEFYNRMYVPYIKNSFGREASLHSLDGLLSRFDRSELLLIKNGEKAIAGDVLEYKKSGPKPFCIGVLDGDRGYVVSGALGAVYYFRLIHLKSKGYKDIDLGFSRAFLRDGVLQYKKKWGLKPTDMNDKGFLIHQLSQTDGIKSFLVNNPAIIYDNGEFSSACFVDGNVKLTPKEQTKWINKFIMPGISKVFVYQLNTRGNLLDICADTIIPVEVKHFEW